MRSRPRSQWAHESILHYAPTNLMSKGWIKLETLLNLQPLGFTLDNAASNVWRFIKWIRMTFLVNSSSIILPSTCCTNLMDGINQPKLIRKYAETESFSDPALEDETTCPTGATSCSRIKLTQKSVELFWQSLLNTFQTNSEQWTRKNYALLQVQLRNLWCHNCCWTGKS